MKRRKNVPKLYNKFGINSRLVGLVENANGKFEGFSSHQYDGHVFQDVT